MKDKPRSYSLQNVINDDHLNAFKRAFQPEYTIYEQYKERDDLDALCFVAIGYVPHSDPLLLAVVDGGELVFMERNEWEKRRYDYNGLDEFGKRVK